ncbi:DNA-binding transcriptional response regulator, NtrC family, contains REC, AAA-type ATPase, and a Fis-type DNA-binding domains [Maridesulfovibrio ferrireducens]|uniref:DNA-binding transcriptional response regulator, NtrC family, contains REC, AAA-type ATPase, and a Fis-type DNA-binding domains n=1 Tax=Maridesulfovibrio ferrireducens TaxID=246191 RepID=A0A1G9KU42_9BACT|nr:sigma-54 dependent transcriptional regulator [Maridesulfovibrio ferrireducens]SDL52795.1 DNA-binding transcriptional response regulator, NtrC family, contains REC, AAA-type ATPase, and a Fis-type DNA-binding domains [Maridesulfovibrio ferrireducens]
MNRAKGLNPSFPLLLVDDEDSWLQSFRATLRSQGIDNVVLLNDGTKVMETLKQQEFCAVAVDLMMPGISGEELIPQIVEEYPEVPVLVISGLNEIKAVVNCIRKGAFDFIVKTEDRNTLIAGVRHAIEIFELRQENSSLKQRFFKSGPDKPELFSEIITAHKDMFAIFKYIEAISETARPVLITGESGVGKELVARAVHNASGRKGNFVAVNIAGLDDNIFSDTLFGHKKGAFTGAAEARLGLVEKAKNGTLFLDEIGDLAPTSQTKLLRLLQEHEFMPLGSDMAKRSSARIITATHQSITKMQDQGKFRKDLFFRLRGHMLQIPPLRERIEDLPLLISHFVNEVQADTGTDLNVDIHNIADFLNNYSFPGNVRELQHLVHDGASICGSSELKPKHFKKLMEIPGDSFSGESIHDSGESVSFGTRLPTLNEVRVKLIDEALRRTNGNQSSAAQLIGVTRQAVSKYLKKSG